VIDRLNKLVQITRRGVKKLVSRSVVSTFYGYNYCETENDKWVREYRFVAEKLRDQELSGKVCLCDSEIDVIEAGINRVNYECKTGSKDFTVEANPATTAWLLANPDCVAYEYAADYLEALCKKIKIDFKVVEQKCQDIGIEIKVTDRVVCDAIDIALQLQEQTCDIELGLNVDLHQCIADVKTILEQTNCEIDLRTYVEKINCGATLETVLTEMNCEANVNVTVGDAINCPASSSVSPSVSASVSPSSSISPSPSPSEEPPLEFTISADDTTPCYYTDVVIEITSPSHVGADYAWVFENGNPSTASGEGPHTVQFTASGTNTITVTGTQGALFTVETLDITVSSCPGNVTGTVKDEFGNGISSVSVRLFNDANADGVSDGGAAVKSVTTSSGGAWSMAILTPGNYVIVMTLPSGWVTVSGIDSTDDSDTVPNTVTTDLIIPVTVAPSEIDANNNFILRPATGTITGNVQDDLGNPIVAATINIYEDDDLNGVPGALVTSVQTDGSGNYSATGLQAGKYALASDIKSYVIELVVPVSYSIVSGIDSTPDSDVVANIPTTDNLITCSLNNGETDADNNFIITL
jgi:hypothetical protein